MKKLNSCILVVLCILLATTTSLGIAPINVKDYALLTIKVVKVGRVPNLGEGYYAYYLLDKLDNIDKEIKMNAKGIFIDTVRANTYAKAIDIFLYAGNSVVMLPLYFNGNKDLYVTLTFKGDDPYPKATFKGEYAKECDYWAKKAEKLLRGKTMQELMSVQEEYGYNEKEFVAQSREEADELIKLAKSLKLNPEFLKGELRSLEYGHYNSLYNYESMHGQLVNDKNYRTSSSFPSFADDSNMDKNNPADYHLNFHYRRLMLDYFARKIFKNETYSLTPDGERMYQDFTMRILRGIPKMQTHEVIKNGILFSVVKDSLGYADDVNQMYAEFMKATTDKKHKEKITTKYQQLLKTKKGMPSPKFVNYENHKGGTLSLDDLRGKYVLIDIWATWCQPCIMEIPHLERLEKKYRKNIAFVSISVDEKNAYRAWKNMVTQKNMRGIQLFADKSFDSEFIKSFSIQSIPRFILIDPEGKIVNPNAPPPSDPSLDKLLSKLLN